jgi:23S rRNA (guanosine2251-2'-O)-methyltransferase
MVKRLFGKKTLLENLHNPNIIKVDLANDEVEIIKLLKTNGIKYQLHHSKDHFFDQFDVGLNHQGIVINLKQSSHSDLEQVLDNIKNQSTGLILIVDSIQDAQNFGAILRTCEAFKVDAVIYKKDNQVPINDFVIKTSMGAINHLNLCNVSNLSQVLALLKKHGY